MIDSLSCYLVNRENFWTGNGFTNNPNDAKPYANRVVCYSVIARLEKRGIVAKMAWGEDIKEEMKMKKETSLGEYVVVNHNTAWMSPRGGAGGWMINRWTKAKDEAHIYKSEKSANAAKRRLEKEGMSSLEVVTLQKWMSM